MALAFPGQSGTLWEVMAHDAFLDALGDQLMRVRILEKDPVTLDEALKLACQMKATARSPLADASDDHGRCRERFACSSGEAESALQMDMDRHINKLESVLGEYCHELNQYREENDRLQHELRRRRQRSPSKDPPSAGEPDRRQTMTPRATIVAEEARSIAQRPVGRAETSRVFRMRSATVHRPSVRRHDTEQRHDADVKTQLTPTSISTLLDTGCERSLIPRNLVPNAKLGPVDFKPFAANSTDISILGSVRLGFTVHGMSLFADLVSDDVEEMMLGIDWLTENDCKWHFVEKQIEIGGRKVHMRSRRSLAGIRRVPGSWMATADDGQTDVLHGTRVKVPTEVPGWIGSSQTVTT